MEYNLYYCKNGDIMKKIGLYIVSVIVILFLGILFFTHSLKKRGLPDYNQNLQMKNLDGKVQVYRDQYGVPSIYATSQKDLYRATGYVMAQDRIWQMDLLRRVTMGRLSEIFGEKLIDVDELFRMLQITEKSKQILEKLSVEEREAIFAFSDGINQYLEKNKDDLPVEYLILGYKPEKWKPIHSINLIGYMAWDLSMALSTEVPAQRIIDKLGYEMYSYLKPEPNRTKSHIYQYTDTYTPRSKKSASLNPEIFNKLRKAVNFTEEYGLNIFKGSNNWVVSGKRSTTGEPILANDMHLGLSSPGIWYQIHQNAPGLHVTGLALPGAPVVVAGHNENIAWGMTNVMIDDSDFYEEKIKNDKDGLPIEYEYQGKWYPVEKKILNIKVKGKKDPVYRTLYFTKHGPIISQIKKIKNKAVSMHWIGNYISNEMRGVYLLNRAKNWKDFTNAVSNFKSVSQNIVYADTEGNIGLYSSAGIPMRKRKEKTFFNDGWIDKYDWQGFVPFEKQPHEKNPKSGILASANNKTVSNDYPYYISLWFYPPYRYDRIVEILMEKEKNSIEDMKNLQLDQISVMARKFIPDILLAMERHQKSSTYRNKEICDLYTKMKNWNYSMDKNSDEAYIFEEFYNKFMRNTLKDEMGEEIYKDYIGNRSSTLYALEQLWMDPVNPWFDDIHTKNIQENKFDIIIKTLLDIVETEALGNASKRWGDAHFFALKHPLGSNALLDFFFDFNRGPFRVGGSFHTVSPYSYKLDKDYNTDSGASHRHVFDLSNWDNSWVVIPTGQSGIVGSVHYLDQTNDYIAGIYHRAWFSREKVEEHAQYKMEFKGN